MSRRDKIVLAVVALAVAVVVAWYDDYGSPRRTCLRQHANDPYWQPFCDHMEGSVGATWVH